MTGAATPAATAPAAERAALSAFLAEELARPVMPQVAAFAAALAERPGVTAILFYGSCLQRQTTEGMLDFYALTDGTPGAWDESRTIARAGRILPPNVYPVTYQGLRAKVAVVPRDEFLARMRPTSLDTTFWARFCQRAALVWVRDDEARSLAVAAVSDAVCAAAIWANRLAPEASGASAWRALFARTYRVEIRVEPRSRAADIVGVDEARYTRLWDLTSATRATAPPAPKGGWLARWWIGKAMHLTRLAKAAFTFEGGPRYLIWKIRRHMRR